MFLFPFKNMAQQEKLQNYSLYPKNHFLFNPANTGDKGMATVFLNYRNQFTEVNNGAPVIYTFGMHSPVSENMSLGGMIVNDNRGVLSNTSANLSYAYRVKLSEESNLVFGLSGGFEERDIVRSKLIVDEQTDNVLLDGDYEGFNFDAGAGIKFDYKNFEIGISMPRISNMRFNALSSVHFILGESKVEMEPFVLFRMMESEALQTSQYEVGSLLEWNKAFWGGFAYRSNGAYVVSAGVNINPFSISYAYDINAGDLSNLSKSSNEVQIIYNFSLMRANKVILDENGEIITNGGVVVGAGSYGGGNYAGSNQVDSLETELSSVRDEVERLLIEFENLKSLERKHLKDNIVRVNNGETSDFSGRNNDSPQGIPRGVDKDGIINLSGDDIVKINSTDDGSNLEHGIYVVIHSFRTRKMAERAVGLMKDIGVSCQIALNKRRSWYYVYTGTYTNRREAITKMYFERKRGFGDAWIYVY